MTDHRLPSPPTMEDTEVSSQRVSPGQGGVDEAVEKVPEVDTSVAKDLGEATPMTTNNGEPHQSGPPPNTIPETNAAPGLDTQPPSREGGRRNSYISSLH